MITHILKKHYKLNVDTLQIYTDGSKVKDKPSTDSAFFVKNDLMGYMIGLKDKASIFTACTQISRQLLNILHTDYSSKYREEMHLRTIIKLNNNLDMKEFFIIKNSMMIQLGIPGSQERISLVNT